MKIDGHLDLFSGIGGFSLGLKQAGIEPRWLGFSDIDKYANKLFKRRFPNAKELGAVEDVSYKKLKGQRIDLLTGGFPCQAFSIAGKRKGFDDTRGTLFFEIQRILEGYIRNKKPISYILLENVKGLLNHDNHRTFTTIYGILYNLNYTIECQLINTKWWLPQSRERIYIFGRYNGNPSGRKIFPIYNSSKKVNDLQGQYANTLTARYAGNGNGSYIVEGEQYAQKERKLKQIGTIGNKNSEALRVYDTTCSRTIKSGGGMGAKTGLYKVTTHSLYPRSSKTGKGGTGHLTKEDGICGTITQHCSRSARRNGMKVIENDTRIRRLTPTECERLQGFPDNWTDGQSDTQRYKQCGNAVSVCVTEAIFKKIYK